MWKSGGYLNPRVNSQSIYSSSPVSRWRSRSRISASHRRPASRARSDEGTIGLSSVKRLITNQTPPPAMAIPTKIRPSSPIGEVPAASSSFRPNQAPATFGTAMVRPTWPRTAAFERAPPGGRGAAKANAVYRNPALGARRLEPPLASEVEGGADRHRHHEDQRRHEERLAVVGDEFPVLAEETGDDGQHQQHGRDAREDLHDLVQAVRDRRQVRVDDVRGELAEGVDLIDHTRDVVVDVLEVDAAADLAQLADITAHEHREDVALRCDEMADP